MAERLNRVNRQFSKENSVSSNVCVNGTNRIVQEIRNDGCCKIYSQDLSSDNLNKSVKREEYVPSYHCDKPSGYVFVDVGNNLKGSEYLIEEDDDICKVSSETLFTDIEIDYNLFKNVTIEKRLKNASKDNEMYNHNLETTVFNINDICTGSDRPGLSTNACMENMCENLDDYDKKPIIDIDYTTSTDVSAFGDSEKVNTYVKEEKSIEDVLVHRSTKNMSLEIKKEEMIYSEEVSILNESIIDIKLHPMNKVEEPPDISANYSCVLDKNSKAEFVLSKTVNSNFQEVHTECSEEMVYNEEVSVLNESIIDIKLHSVNKVEESLDISTNYSCVLDKNSKTGFIVLSKSINSDFQEFHTECSEEMPDNSDIGSVMDLKPLEENETAQSKRESHLKLQNKVQSLNRTCSELQIKPQTNSGDDTGAAGVECNNKLNEDDVNTQVKNRNDAVCQHHRKKKSKNKTDKHYVCKVCDKDFTQLCDLKVHKCTHTGDRPFGCSTCGKAFTQLANLNVHKRIHTGDRPFGCDTCGKTFIQLASLQSHKLIHTGDRPFCCDTCGKTFKRMGHLKDHIRIHTGDRPFGCDTCGKAFTCVTSLKRHKRVHTGDRPFGCDTCGKAFTQMNNLKEHIRIHTGDKPFCCVTCGKVFSSLTSLIRHKPVHTGDRPFGCDTCGKAFTRMGHLKDHIRIHTADRPFGCDTCGKAFTCVTSLKRHKSKHTHGSS